MIARAATAEPECNLALRLAEDRARGNETTYAARAFVRSHCPCQACRIWREDQARIPALRLQVATALAEHRADVWLSLCTASRMCAPISLCPAHLKPFQRAQAALVALQLLAEPGPLLLVLHHHSGLYDPRS